MAKRNKTKETQKTTTEEPVKAEKPEVVEEAVNVDEKAKKPVVNADEMAKAVKSTTGNDYQQYIRNLFKDKLNRR